MKKESMEKLYIKKRKFKAFLHGLLYYVCRLFPVKKNKIAFCTLEGKGGFGCSPKYIANELMKRDVNGRYEIVWIVNDMTKPFPEPIRKVKNTLLSRTYHLATARVWVDNSRKPYGTKIRKSQLYIQTWHATVCTKPIGLYREELLPEIARLVSEYDSGLITYVLSGSDWCSSMYRKGLIYQGEIIKTGTPRCDVLFNRREETRVNIRKLYNLPEQSKIVLYAPTFRGGSQTLSRSVEANEAAIDFKKLVEALERRFKGQWRVMLRLHPQLAAEMAAMKTGDDMGTLTDASQYPDMNELIAACDAFVSDYSSAAFEAAMIDIPVFTYADDLDEYIEERGKLMFDIYALPYPVARNNEELIKNIMDFDEEAYIKNNKAFLAGLGIEEDGHASERVADLIETRLNAD